MVFRINQSFGVQDKTSIELAMTLVFQPVSEKRKTELASAQICLMVVVFIAGIVHWDPGQVRRVMPKDCLKVWFSIIFQTARINDLGSEKRQTVDELVDLSRVDVSAAADRHLITKVAQEIKSETAEIDV